MAEIAAEKVSPRGVGVPYVPLVLGPMVLPASKTGMGHIRNRGTFEVSLAVTVGDAENGPDGLGPRVMEIEVPPGAARFFALVGRLADPGTQSITFTVSGDVSDADIVVLERNER
jgi:hypothetical protein